VFSAALRANLVWLTIIGVVNSAIGAYYYLRIIVMMYMRESRKEVPVSPISPALGLALAVSIVATLYLGLLPNRVLQIAQHSAESILPSSPTPSGMAQNPQKSLPANQ
jgi:NADH-quinone oxidoreductase subunit N